MRALFIAWRDLANPKAGGSEVLVDRLAAGLVERGHDAALLCAGPIGQRAYPVIDAGSTYGQYLTSPIWYLRHFRDWDLVVDVANGVSFFSPLWRSHPSICLVNHVHTAMWGEWFSPALAAFGRVVERDLMPKVYRHRLFMAVSDSTATELVRIGVDRRNIRVIPNGVDPITGPLYSRSAEPLFLSVSRLVPHKRIDLLLRMWDRVRPHTGGQLVVVGSGPELDRLRSMAGEGVEFRGFVSEEEKYRLMSEAWILLHPAHVEGWGLVVTEAAQRGTPAIAFDVSGLRDSIIDQESGVLAGSEDDFVRHWVDLTRNSTRRRELGEGARRRAAKLPWSRTVGLFIDMAGEAMSAHPSAGRRRHAFEPVIDLNSRPALESLLPPERAAVRARH